MDQPYKYTPLPPGSDQIRLLTLLPASDENEEIAVSLQNIETKEAERQYETLSYVWGSPDNPETISIVTQERRHSLTDWWRKRRWRKSKGSPTDTSPGADPKDEDVSSAEHNGVPFPVTQNLGVALRHLRLRDAPRTLWIDAICIDQKNIPEKSEQVAKMAQIYSSSQRVVIWLGPASPDSDLAMGHVDHLGKMVRVDVTGGTLTLTPEGEAEPHWADLDHPLPYDEADLRALEGLFWRPYFERLWVVQEARLNPETAVVCGRQETTWQSVTTTCTWLARKVGGPKTDLRDDFANRIQRIRMVFEETLYDGASLQDLARSTRGLKCADDRDRVYALLSLAQHGDRIKPDYSLSTVQVFQKIPELSVGMGDARFLSHCELRSRKLEGPTWIPDWTAKGMSSRLSWFNAASFAWQSSAKVFPEEGRLRVTGVRVGAVADATVVHMHSYSPSYVQRAIAHVVPADAESSTYKTGCSLLEAYSGTLIANGFTSLPSLHGGTMTRQKAMDSVRACLQSGDSGASEPGPEHHQYLGSAWPTMRGRSLLRTEEGYVGLGPINMQTGDIVVAFLSCTTFTVVRPSPEHGDRYTVLGEAFVYGLTNGEAVLGPFPEHIQAEYQPDPESGKYFNAYRDTRTDGVSKTDPRLEALGIPFETRPDGSARLVSAEQLLEAGVGAEQFNLV